MRFDKKIKTKKKKEQKTNVKGYSIAMAKKQIDIQYLDEIDNVTNR